MSTGAIKGLLIKWAHIFYDPTAFNVNPKGMCCQKRWEKSNCRIWTGDTEWDDAAFMFLELPPKDKC